MAALTDATVIVEASDTSGSLHQAAECLRIGRWLFIGKSLVDRRELEWPKKFLDSADRGARVRILVSTAELVREITS
jgi:DNA processing protein